MNHRLFQHRKHANTVDDTETNHQQVQQLRMVGMRRPYSDASLKCNEQIEGNGIMQSAFIENVHLGLQTCLLNIGQLDNEMCNVLIEWVGLDGEPAYHRSKPGTSTI